MLCNVCCLCSCRYTDRIVLRCGWSVKKICDVLVELYCSVAINFTLLFDDHSVCLYDHFHGLLWGSIQVKAGDSSGYHWCNYRKTAKSVEKADEDNSCNFMIALCCESEFSMQMRHWNLSFDGPFRHVSLMQFCPSPAIRLLMRLVDLHLKDDHIEPVRCFPNQHAQRICRLCFRPALRVIAIVQVQEVNDSICIWHQTGNCDAMNWLSG